MHKLIRIIIVSLIVQGCASSPKASNNPTDVKRVGVISVLGNSVEVSYVGVTAFGNKFDSIDITDMKLDEFYQRKLEDHIADTGMYEVVHIEYNHDLWADTIDSFDDLSFWKKMAFSDLKTIQPLLAKAGQEYELDAIFILSPLSAYTGTRIEPTGISVYKGGIANNLNWCRVGVFSLLSVANAKDGSIEKRRPVRSKANSFFTDAVVDMPQKRLRGTDMTVCDFSGADVSLEQKEQLEEYFKSMIEPKHLINTLDKLMKASSLSGH